MIDVKKYDCNTITLIDSTFKSTDKIEQVTITTKSSNLPICLFNQTIDYIKAYLKQVNYKEVKLYFK